MNLKSLFSLNDHPEGFRQSSDPLERLATVVDFESFRDLLAEQVWLWIQPEGDLPPFDLVLMFKILNFTDLSKP